MRKVPYSYLIVFLIIIAFTVQTCSRSNTTPTGPDPKPNPAGLLVSPSSGSPGTLLNISGYTPNPSDTGIKLFVGDQPTTFRSDSAGIHALIPLFLDSTTHWPSPPTVAQDVSITKNGEVVALATAAVTVDSLAHADGSTAEIQNDFAMLTNSLHVIYSSLPNVPGADPRLQGYQDAVMAMLDSLVAGADSSLASIIAGTSSWTNGEAPDLALVDAVLASSGALDFYNEAAGSLGSLTTSLASASQQGIFCKEGGPDMDLACQMQIYVVLDDYAIYFVKPTTAGYANTVGLAAGVIALGGIAFPPEKIISGLLTIFDFVYGTLAPSLFPAEISNFSLAVATDTVGVGEMTSTTLSISAVNHPAMIRATDVLETLITALGFANGSGGVVQSFREVLINAMKWALGLYRKAVEQYNAQTGNSVFIDPEAPLPSMSWGPVIITNPDLVELYSFTEDIIIGDSAAFEWKGIKRGEGRIQARARAAGERSKVLLDNTLCFGCIYAGGAFGNNAPGTATKSVVVGKPALIDLQIAGLPSGLDGNVVVVGTNYSSGQLATGKLLKDLDPGDYMMTAVEVKDNSGEIYKPEPLDTTVTLQGGDTATIAVTYKKKFGNLFLTVTGLTPGFFHTDANIDISGPNGVSIHVVNDTLVDSLAEGDYTIVAQRVTELGTGKKLAPNPASQVVTVKAGETALANVDYKSRYGAILMNVKIRHDILADIDVEGDSLTKHITDSTIIMDVYEGVYTIVAYDVPLDANTRLIASPAAQGVVVSGGDTVRVDVKYDAPMEFTWVYGPSDKPLGKVFAKTSDSAIDRSNIDEPLGPPGFVVNEHCVIIGPLNTAMSAGGSASSPYSNSSASIDLSAGGASATINVDLFANASNDSTVNPAGAGSSAEIGFGTQGNFLPDNPEYPNMGLASGLNLRIYNPARDTFIVIMNYDFNISSDIETTWRASAQFKIFSTWAIYNGANFENTCGQLYYTQDSSCTQSTVDCWRGARWFTSSHRGEGAENATLDLGVFFLAEVGSLSIPRSATVSGTITVNIIR